MAASVSEATVDVGSGTGYRSQMAGKYKDSQARFFSSQDYHRVSLRD
jgi:hypothetical protein